MYIYIYIYIHTYIYIYIYTERERDTHIYIYIYIYISSNSCRTWRRTRGFLEPLSTASARRRQIIDRQGQNLSLVIYLSLIYHDACWFLAAPIVGPISQKEQLYICHLVNWCNVATTDVDLCVTRTAIVRKQVEGLGRVIIIVITIITIIVMIVILIVTE